MDAVSGKVAGAIDRDNDAFVVRFQVCLCLCELSYLVYLVISSSLLGITRAIFFAVFSVALATLVSVRVFMEKEGSSCDISSL